MHPDHMGIQMDEMAAHMPGHPLNSDDEFDADGFAEFDADVDALNDDDEPASEESPRSAEHRWSEPADTFRGRLLPEPGTVVVTRGFSRQDINGVTVRHCVGEVLWTQAVHHITETRWTHRYETSRHVTESLRIQLADGRVAHLDSSAPTSDDWHIQTADELAAQVVVFEQVDAMVAAAASLGDVPAARDLARQAVALRETTGLPPPPRPGRAAGPLKPDMLTQLEQDTHWWPNRGGPIAVSAMGPRHKRNTLAMLRRSAISLWGRWIMTFHNAPDEVISSLDRDPAEWLESQPLVRRLALLIELDVAAGVPDEVPPTEEQLAMWRQHTGRAADGSEDHLETRV